MKKIITLAVLTGLLACTDEVMQPYDKSQRPAEINVKGFSKPDVLQLRLNGKPVSINGSTSYTNTIETKLSFVVDEGETDQIEIYNSENGKQIAKYSVNFNNTDQYKNLNFFNLPGIYLQTYAVKPQVNLGKVGFELIFPNLGEYSNSSSGAVKGILKKENGDVLAEFDNIEKNNFSALKMYSFFSAVAPVYLELYKQGTMEPYFGSQIIKVKIKQDIGANMIVLQEKLENGTVVVMGSIDIADYL
ncbi:hypothetical protein M2347_000327 [Chryseobacterium sp. H1D6B]|uniref:hypothetical protein n=1 Tax=Chryseobacterium sp. H1D6B TaxID=2940588 RepID=UPI0015CE89CB|nr:hypothetical protein [Chryseobacterium sp. H1D6B]MDH6250600.1 hypothetical protein [Chryseobacterium sp. H1D6B]